MPPDLKPLQQLSTNYSRLAPSTAVRALVDELKNLSLLKEPGQDVDIFGGRVVELCRRISSTGMRPS
jgi:hypothetical protein